MENKQKEVHSRGYRKARYHLLAMTVTAMMTALAMVLERFLSIKTEGWKISFGFVPIVLVAILFGPVYAAISYGLTDLIGAILFPFGPYFPGFTACAALMGILYGVFLYRGYENLYENSGKKFLQPRVLIPSFINSLLIGLLINTIWVSILYGSRTYWGWFIYRLPQYAVLVPLHLVIIPLLLPVCRELSKRIPFDSEKRI